MKLFKTVKVIKSKEGVLHFKRFAIIECKWFNVYIHSIYKADEDKHLHDHPWDYLSVCLSGSFLEESHSIFPKLVKPGSISMQDSVRFHKILKLLSNRVITLFITGKRKREWGYAVNGNWIDNVTYRKMKNEGKI